MQPDTSQNSAIRVEKLRKTSDSGWDDIKPWEVAEFPTPPGAHQEECGGGGYITGLKEENNSHCERDMRFHPYPFPISPLWNNLLSLCYGRTTKIVTLGAPMEFHCSWRKGTEKKNPTSGTEVGKHTGIQTITKRGRNIL